MADSLVTVYIPCHNYGHYLDQAVESVLKQTYENWELIIIDDGSQDLTGEKAENYKNLYPKKIRVISHSEAQGLQASANEALRSARGRYVMRLDADDFLDENALLILAGYLDRHPDIALVFPNYIYVDKRGQYLGVEHRKRIGSESQVLDLPAHGACTMVRKRVLKSVGGYNENFDRQDGYDLWLKVINRYRVANVETPLFYYRQHDESLTRNEEKLLEVREKIKRINSNRENLTVPPRVLAVVGAKNTYQQLPNIVLAEIAGQPLINFTLDVALQVEAIDKVLVSTDDSNVFTYCQEIYPDVLPLLRSPELSEAHVGIPRIIANALDYVEQQGIYPDIVVWLSVNCPLRGASDIYEAINTLLLYNVDSVLSVYEDYKLHYVHGMNGLEELNPAMHRQIRLEREALFVDNGAIRALWRDNILEDRTLSTRVGHFIMPQYRSIQIKNKQDLWFAEKILQALDKKDFSF